MAKKTSIIFATFSAYKNKKRLATNGMVEPMLYYFTPRTKKFVLIDQPYPGSDILTPIIEIYKGKKKIQKKNSSILVKWLNPILAIRNTMGTRIPFKIRDFLSVLDFIIFDKEKYDLFVGLESINALAGAVLKKLGYVDKVVYYVSDYSPSRYKAGWFNSIYLTLDRLAATHSDYIWDVSLAMMPARIKAGLNKKKASPVIHVPNALFPKQINYYPASKITPYSLIYAGTLGKENGPDLAIESIAIMSKKFPKVSLHIFGGGEKDLERLRKLTNKLKLTDQVHFHGFITDQVLLSKTIRKYAIGIAPYKEIPGDPRWWADATKIRLYLAAGLPVITTRVPPLGKEVVKANAGVISKDNPKDFAKEIMKLFKNKKQFTKMKNNAINKGRNNTWNKTYSDAMEQIVLEMD